MKKGEGKARLARRLSYSKSNYESYKTMNSGSTVTTTIRSDPVEIMFNIKNFLPTTSAMGLEVPRSENGSWDRRLTASKSGFGCVQERRHERAGKRA